MIEHIGRLIDEYTDVIGVCLVMCMTGSIIAAFVMNDWRVLGVAGLLYLLLRAL